MLREIFDLDLKAIMLEDGPKTFLIGAGCSIDPPSCLPAGREMIEAIIKYICTNSEMNNILQLSDLRFESIIEIIQETLDPNLKILDYYMQCDKPNLQHLFLAQMIQQGHFVLTTNFDLLIEYALINSGISKKDIIPIITKHDYFQFNHNNEILKYGKILVKIHGSPINIITGENTGDSLIATIKALGRNKEGINIFQIEPFKRYLIENVMEDRILIVMGYSGSDDFDIIPTLKLLKNLKMIVWINHVSNKRNPVILEVKEASKQNINLSGKTTQILKEIKLVNNSIPIFQVDIDTSRLIEDFLNFKSKIDSSIFNKKPEDWFKENIKTPSEIRKIQCTAVIYFFHDKYDDALRCEQIVLEKAEKANHPFWKMIAHNNIGRIKKIYGNLIDAKKHMEKAVKIADLLGPSMLNRKEAYTNNLGEIYRKLFDYKKALTCFENALQLARQLEDIAGISSSFNSIAGIYGEKGDILKAKKYFLESIKFAKQIGDLKVIANRLINIGGIHLQEEDYENAKRYFEEALEIAENLMAFSEIAIAHYNFGRLFKALKKYQEAIEKYQEALHITKQIGDLRLQAKCLNNIGLCKEKLGDHKEAFRYYRISLKIAEENRIEDLRADCLTNIGVLIARKGNFSEALKKCEEAYQIYAQIGLKNSTNALIIKKNIAIFKKKLKV